MERGLLWLPLLAMFIWLAWAGWNEYQKVEAYQVWGQQFERSKYDIYAVLGQKGTDLTWGKPNRKGPIDLVTFSLKQVESIDLLVDEQQVNLEAPPQSGRVVVLKLQFHSSGSALKVRFTEIPLAVSWAKHLQQCLLALQSEKIE